eukprot:10884417-Lingulodinium_polyedra.AAC.1
MSGTLIDAPLCGAFVANDEAAGSMVSQGGVADWTSRGGVATGSGSVWQSALRCFLLDELEYALRDGIRQHRI